MYRIVYTSKLRSPAFKATERQTCSIGGEWMPQRGSGAVIVSGASCLQGVGVFVNQIEHISSISSLEITPC